MTAFLNHNDFRLCKISLYGPNACMYRLRHIDQWRRSLLTLCGPDTAPNRLLKVNIKLKSGLFGCHISGEVNRLKEG